MANTNKKETKEKKTPKKKNTKVEEEKKEIETKKENKKTTEYVLLIIFGILLILVLVLGGIILLKQDDIKRSKTDLIYEVRKKDNADSIKVYLSELVKTKNLYVLKITNYIGENINEEEITYKIKVTNKTKSKVRLTKGDSKKNLITNQKETIINGKTLSNKKKEEVYYYLSVIEKNKLKSKDYITISIET